MIAYLRKNSFPQSIHASFVLIIKNNSNETICSSYRMHLIITTDILMCKPIMVSGKSSQ